MAGRAFTVTLGLPPRALHPNSRPHHMAKANAKKKYRVACRDATMIATNVDPPLLRKASILFTFRFWRRHQHDRDNLLAWIKSGIDGMADGGLVANDRDLTFLPIEVQYVPKTSILANTILVNVMEIE